jgi:GNAT superfamily N-acetyltransferase
VSQICLLTADRGGDATGQYSSDELMPDLFVRPHVELEPDSAFVVEAGSRVEGYVVCAPDTALFVRRLRREWVPRLARRYQHVTPPRTRDEQMRHLGFTPELLLLPEPELAAFPAHLHIDLLPALRRRGLGRALMDRLVAHLRERGVPGLHLSMDPANVSARAFYDRLGFHELGSSTRTAPRLGLRLG